MSLLEKEEWFQKFKDRYRKANRVRKSQLLDEITDLHGYHRKSVIRALRAKPRGENRKVESVADAQNTIFRSL